MPFTSRNAFTLIELLVVITIIVVLLALLTPALDKAIYQAELTVCSSKQRTIAGGVVVYAMSFKRSYPYKDGVFSSDDGGWRLSTLYTGAQPGNQSGRLEPFDYRGLIMPYVPLDAYLDPLTGVVDISKEGNDSDVTVQSTYQLLDGIQFQPARGQGMLKVGNRLTYLDSKFNLLVADTMLYHRQDQTGSFSHQDATGRFTLIERENDLAVSPIKLCFTTWNLSDAAFEHGDIDNNFAYQDGSVRRFSALPMAPVNVDDRRLADGNIYPLAPAPWAEAGVGYQHNPLRAVWMPPD